MPGSQQKAHGKKSFKWYSSVKIFGLKESFEYL